MVRASRESAPLAIVAPRRDLCLDFANTFPRPNGEFGDSLHRLADLLNWSKENGLLDAAALARVEHWAAKYPADSGALFEEALILRATLYGILFGLTEKGAPEAHALAAL